MKIKAKIAEITAALTWQIQHERGDGNMEITSNPWEKSHTIKIPRGGTDWRDIEYLHELAHAVLAEKHHLLSTAYFTRGIDNKIVQSLANPCRVASDWYADDLLMRWFPDETRAEIKEHAGYAIKYTEHDKDIFYGGGLFLAQEIYYCGGKIHTIPRRYRPVVDILLACDPSRPGVTAKRDLINNLATLTIKYRVDLVSEEGIEVWKIKKA